MRQLKVREKDKAPRGETEDTLEGTGALPFLIEEGNIRKLRNSSFLLCVATKNENCLAEEVKVLVHPALPDELRERRHRMIAQLSKISKQLKSCLGVGDLHVGRKAGAGSGKFRAKNSCQVIFER
jgi:hypothetical protein